MFDLSGKIAVITGGGSGIGKAIAILFAQRGAEVHLLDLNEETASEVVQQIIDEGGQAFWHPCDVGDQQAVDQAFGQVGCVHILVNNAGIAHVGNLEKTSESDFDKVLRVNVKGMYNCLRAAVPRMKAKQGGVILNMSSIATWVGLPDRFAYSMSKGAVLAMTQSVARDYLQAYIRCNCISPARVYTPFVEGFLQQNYPDNRDEMFEKLSQAQPIGRMGQPKEIATLALYLCSEEASFITGCDYPIDGGLARLNT